MQFALPTLTMMRVEVSHSGPLLLYGFEVEQHRLLNMTAKPEPPKAFVRPHDCRYVLLSRSFVKEI